MSNPSPQLQFRPLAKTEAAPPELLLLADPDESAVERYLGKSAVTLAFLNERLIGVYVLFPHNSACAEIKNIAISETEQGKGFGRQLLAHAIQSAKTQDYQELWIGTANTSFGQLALYQKMGFRIFEIRKDYFIKHYPEPIYENGLRATDMLMLQLKLTEETAQFSVVDLNQITLPVRSVAVSFDFYSRLGLQPIVVSLPHYVRLFCSNGTTLSLEEDPNAAGKNGARLYFETEQLDKFVAELQTKGFHFESQPTNQSWLWREASLIDPDGHVLIFYHAGEMRLNPPWRVKQ